MTSFEKGRALFRASRVLEDTWREVGSLAGLFSRHISKFADENRPFRITQAGNGSPDFSDWNMWVYQCDYEFRRRKRTNPDIYFALEFRLCWDDADRITTVNGNDFEEPLVFVKGSSIDSWDYLEPKISLDADEGYTSYGRLLWYRDKDGICWLYAVPLFSITSEKELVSEIVQPLTAMLNSPSSASPEQLQTTAFANSQYVVSWQNGENGTAHIVD